MTTGIYKKGKYLATDKRSTGGHVGLADTAFKMINIGLNSGNTKVLMACSGNRPLKGFIEQIVGKIFTNTELTIPEKLFVIRSELKKYYESFENIIVIVKYADDECINKISEEAYLVSSFSVTEIDEDIVTIGSGGAWLDGVICLMSDMKVEELFAFAASKDCTTCKEFDLIDLTK